MAFALQEVHGERVSVLHAAGEVDIAVADELVANGRTILEERAGLELDLSQVTFIDSSGLGALVRLRKYADELNKTMSLVRVSAPVERLLEITGLTSVISSSTTS